MQQPYILPILYSQYHWPHKLEYSISSIRRVNAASVLETKAGPSVRDQQLLARTRNFLHISLQINV